MPLLRTRSFPSDIVETGSFHTDPESRVGSSEHRVFTPLGLRMLDLEYLSPNDTPCASVQNIHVSSYAPHASPTHLLTGRKFSSDPMSFSASRKVDKKINSSGPSQFSP